MSNSSIVSAFERMWAHVTNSLRDKADSSDIADIQIQLDNIEDNILNIDYENTLAFDTSEIIFNTSTTTSILGKAILGKMILG